jgi:hypothetical protein
MYGMIRCIRVQIMTFFFFILKVFIIIILNLFKIKDLINIYIKK